MSAYLFDIGAIDQPASNFDEAEPAKLDPKLRVTDDNASAFELSKEVFVDTETSFTVETMTATQSVVKATFVVGYVKSKLVKQVYAPCRLDLTLTIQLKSIDPVSQQSTDKAKVEKNEIEDLLPRESVAKEFVGKRVQMTSSKSGVLGNILKNYYVESLSTTYFADARRTGMQVELHCFSPEKVLTLNKYSKVYLGQKFGEEVLKEGLSHVNKDNFGFGITCDQRGMLFLKYSLGTDAEANTDTDAGTASKNKHEFIQPYLVQYNESFYDFMCRTANRNGEFVFFEDGKLCVGIPDFDPASEKCLQLDRDYTSVTYPDMSDNNLAVGSFTRNYHKKQAQFSTGDELQYDFELANDDYLDTKIERQYDLLASNVPGVGAVVNKVAGCLAALAELVKGEPNKIEENCISMLIRICSMAFGDRMGGLFYFFMNGVLASVMARGAIINTKQRTNEYFNSKYFPDDDKDKIDETLRTHNAHFDVNEQRRTLENVDTIKPFANNFTPEEWQTDIKHFYEGVRSVAYISIRKHEENAMSQTVTLTYTGKYKHLKLGSVVRLSKQDDKLYVVTRYELEHDKTGPSIQIQIMPLVQMNYANDVVSVMMPFPPVYASGSSIREAKPQVAWVVDNVDPEGMGRVRIRYPWQGGSADQKDDASPWIRMSTPMASQGGGFMYAPHVGDEVIVDYVHGDIEQPFVIGALYSKANKAPGIKPTRAASDSKDYDAHGYAIKSVNGHSIIINDENNFANFWRSASEGWKGLRWLMADQTYTKVSAPTKGLVGGMSLKDEYGLYNISMSSTDRTVSVSCPLGKVSINAFTGIKINAPHGNISIVGKNVDIKAGNKLTLTSGTNLDVPATPFKATMDAVRKSGPNDGLLATSIGMFFGVGAAALSTMISSVAAPYVANAIDVSLLRSIADYFLQPVDGTLQIKSYRYLELEAGSGKTNIPQRDAFKGDKFEKNTSLLNRINIFIKYLDSQVNTFVNQVAEEYNAATRAYLAMNTILLEHIRMQEVYDEVNFPEVYSQYADEIKGFPGINELLTGELDIDDYTTEKKRALTRNRDVPAIKAAIETTRYFSGRSDLADPLIKSFNDVLVAKLKELNLDYKEAIAAVKLEEVCKSRIEFFSDTDFPLIFTKEITVDIFKSNLKFLKRKLAYQFIESLVDRAADRFFDLKKSVLSKEAIRPELKVAQGKTVMAADKENLLDDMKWVNYVGSIRDGKKNHALTGLAAIGDTLNKVKNDLTGIVAESEGYGKWGAAYKGQILISDQVGITTVLDRGIPKVMQDQENLFGLWTTLNNL